VHDQPSHRAQLGERGSADKTLGDNGRHLFLLLPNGDTHTG
jgi:GTPase involved in cell partitioning and DNA repair